MNRIKMGMGMVIAMWTVMGLSSCEKDGLSGKEGKIAVHFTLSGLSYGEEDSDMRSAGWERMEPETVMETVEGDLKMYATLEEDEAAPLRESLETMEVGTRLRIVAYANSTGAYAGDAEYEVTDANGGIAPVSSHPVGLIVPSAGEYRFVAYSLNTDDDLAYEASMGPYVAGSDDVLWGKTGVETVVDGGANVFNMKMYHQFSRLTLAITSAGLGYDIEALGDVYVVGYKANLVVKDGLAKDVAEEQALTRQTELPAAAISYARREVYSGGESVTTVQIPSATINGVALNFPVPVRLNRQLEPGKSYTLTVSFKTLRWARSNIYWDDTAQTLTFIPTDGTTDYEGYQGVFFQWGSLVGVSPAQNPDGETDAIKNKFTDSIPIYVPYDYPALPKWKKTEGRKVKDDPDIPAATDSWTLYGGYTYKNTAAAATFIPYMDGSYARETEVTYGRTNTYVMDAALNRDTTYQGMRGDICQYLSKTGAVAGNYRLPMSYEFGRGTTTWNDNPNADGWFTAGSSSTNNTLGNEHGTTILIKGTSPYNKRYITHSLMGGVVLPATGFRGGDGVLQYVGYSGDYWTGSAYSYNSGYSLDFNNTGTNSGGSWDHRHYANAVRCVVN